MNREHSHIENTGSSSLPNFNKPVDMINPKSYLGIAFNELRQRLKAPEITEMAGKDNGKNKKSNKHAKRRQNKPKKKHSRKKPTHRKEQSPISVPNESDSDSERQPSEPSDPSSDSSDSESSELSNSSDEQTSDESTNSDSSILSNNRTKNVRRLRTVDSNSRSLFKPIPPEKYDGSPSIQKFFRFIKQTDEYLTDGRAPKEREVSIASKFLDGKAYDFYLLNVSLQPQRWLWHEFAEALFNHCFPADFRTRQRSKLNNFRQRILTVKEYISQMYELFIVVGLDVENNNDERMMADKFWHGLRIEIQEQLWLSNMNPDVNSLEDIKLAAERIEMAQSVVAARNSEHLNRNHEHRAKRDRRMNNRSKGYNPHRPERNPEQGRQNTYHRRDKNSFRRKTNTTPNTNNGKFRRTRRSHSPTYRRKQKNFRESHKSNWVPQEEWDRRRREGKCLKCGDGGHMTRQCPEAQVVSSSSGGPPGLRANNVEVVNIEETERLRTLADTTECANEIVLATLELEQYNEDSKSEISSYATCLDIPDFKSDQEVIREPETCEIYDDIPDLRSISNSSIDEDNIYKRSVREETEEIGICAADEYLNEDCKIELLNLLADIACGDTVKYQEKSDKENWVTIDGDPIAVPTTSSIYEFLHQGEVISPWERVNEWVRDQFRTNAQKEETDDNFGQRMFRFIDDGLHHSGSYHSGTRVLRFLCSNNGLIGDMAKNKLEKVMMEFFPKRWYQMEIQKNRERYSVSSVAWYGRIWIEKKHLIEWKPSVVARYIWRKLCYAANRTVVPPGIIRMIEEILVECDYEDGWVANAEFLLNSKVGMLWAGFTNDDCEEFEYCY